MNIIVTTRLQTPENLHLVTFKGPCESFVCSFVRSFVRSAVCFHGKIGPRLCPCDGRTPKKHCAGKRKNHWRQHLDELDRLCVSHLDMYVHTNVWFGRQADPERVTAIVVVVVVVEDSCLYSVCVLMVVAEGVAPGAVFASTQTDVGLVLSNHTDRLVDRRVLRPN